MRALFVRAAVARSGCARRQAGHNARRSLYAAHRAAGRVEEGRGTTRPAFANRGNAPLGERFKARRRRNGGVWYGRVRVYAF